MNNDDERDYGEERTVAAQYRDEMRPTVEVFITMHTLAALVGVNYDTAKRWRYDLEHRYRRPPNDFPKPWGGVLMPGTSGTRSPVFPLSEVLDWLARRRPSDLRIALEFGNIGHELGRLDERARERQSSKASLASS